MFEKKPEAGTALSVLSKPFQPKDSRKVLVQPEAKSGAQEISRADLYSKIEPQPQTAPVTDLALPLYSPLSLPSQQQKSLGKVSEQKENALELAREDLVAGPTLAFGKDEF